MDELFYNWISCSVLKQFSIRNQIRLLDTYLSEERGFNKFLFFSVLLF